MGALSSWVEGNWFSLVQTVGIMGTLWMAATAARRDAKAREIENLLKIAEHHRELWNEARQRPALERIFRQDADVLSKPATVAEEEFLNLAIVHFQTGWRLAKSGGVTTISEWVADTRDFFSLPLPRAIWEKTKSSRNRRFVRFVERALAN